MKRDFDLIRSILLQTEEAEPGIWFQTITPPDGSITAPMVAEHVALMAEHGLLEAEVASVVDGYFSIGRLTWEGHDFLANARNETVWKHVMAQIKEKGLALTISVVTGLLSKEALRIAGL